MKLVLVIVLLLVGVISSQGRVIVGSLLGNPVPAYFTEIPVSLKQAHNDFLVFCNDTFPENDNQRRSIAEFTQVAEQRKVEAQSVMSTNQVLGLTMMMEASELIHRAIGQILEVKNEAARWPGCSYDTNASWDYIEYHEELDE